MAAKKKAAKKKPAKKTAAKTKTKPAVPWHGPESARERLVPLSGLKPDPKNPRVHPKVNLDALEAILREVGQREPIIVRGKFILAGNGRARVMKERLGWTEVWVEQADDLTPEQARAYAIAANKTGELADWDFAVLSQHFASMPSDLRPVTGFKAYEIEPLLAADWSPNEATHGESGEPTRGKHGGIYFVATQDQAEVIKQAIERIREAEVEAISDGRALELICADYLAGA